MTTDTTTAAIEAMLKNVTPGPWAWNVRGFVGPVSTDDDQSFGMICDEVAECTFSNGSKEANARFIAAARDLVPALAAELATARAERDEARLREKALLDGNEINRKTMLGHNARHATELAALRKEVERLREAMAPFDRMAGAMFARNWNKDGVAISFVERDGPIRLTFADFLAVRSAMITEPLGHGVTADDFGGEA